MEIKPMTIPVEWADDTLFVAYRAKNGIVVCGYDEKSTVRVYRSAAEFSQDLYALAPNLEPYLTTINADAKALLADNAALRHSESKAWESVKRLDAENTRINDQLCDKIRELNKLKEGIKECESDGGCRATKELELILAKYDMIAKNVAELTLGLESRNDLIAKTGTAVPPSTSERND